MKNASLVGAYIQESQISLGIFLRHCNLLNKEGKAKVKLCLKTVVIQSKLKKSVHRMCATEGCLIRLVTPHVLRNHSKFVLK